MVKIFLCWEDVRAGDIIVDSACPHVTVGLVTKLRRAEVLSRTGHMTMLVCCLRTEGFVDVTQEKGMTWVLRREQ